MAARAKPAAAGGASRRAVLLGGAALGGLAAAGPVLAPLRALAAAAPAPVVGFHADRPYLDPTGIAEPYRPGEGPRGAQAVAGRAGHISPRIHLI